MFKQMISDRMLMTWNMGLLWCRAKTAYIDIIFDKVRKIDRAYWPSGKEKNKRKSRYIKEALGLIKDDLGRKHEFDDVIEYEKLDAKEKEYWTNVAKWVDYFSNSMLLFEDYLKSSSIRYLSDEEKAEKLNGRFKLNNVKLSKFIIKYGT